LEGLGIVNGNLEHFLKIGIFRAIWPFVVIWYIFSRFGIIKKEKSGFTGPRKKEKKRKSKSKRKKGNIETRVLSIKGDQFGLIFVIGHFLNRSMPSF
jgi:hypothetical protein